jgi:hypothetical protein
MVATLRTPFVLALAVLLSSAPFVRASAQSSCLMEVAKDLLSKAGVPTSRVAVLLRVLTPDSTADASIDQVTQLSPTFANRNASELQTEDENLDKAQQAVKKMPLTEDTQNCISNMQKVRENIKKELGQRTKENIPVSLSPNQFRALGK